MQKKDMSYRFAVDYRALNDQIKKDFYPLPDVKEILDKLQGSRFFSSLNGASAYWSIPFGNPTERRQPSLHQEGNLNSA